MPKRNTIRREFSYTRPILYNGESYPSADSIITDENGRRINGKIFTDASGQYYTLDANRNIVPVIPMNNLDEITASANRKRTSLEDALGRSLVMGNDNTQVNNLPHRQYNTYLKENAERGAKEHALWDKNYPNLSAWRDAATAVPLAVAATPFVVGGGSALLNTGLGQVARQGFTTLMNNPYVAGINDAVGLGFAGKGFYDVSQGRFTPETAMDIAGGYGLMFKGFDSLNTFMKGRKAKDFNNTSSVVDNVFNRIKSDYPLKGETEIPIDIRADAAKKYTSFINSNEYQNRIQRAGLENHWDYMKELTDRRVNNNGYFPSKVEYEINNNPDIFGMSDIEPSSPNYGITLQEDLPREEVNATLMHELSHWATGNAGTSDIANSVKYPFRNDPNSNYIGDIMRYNEGIVPNIEWDNILNGLPKSMPVDKVIRVSS